MSRHDPLIRVRHMRDHSREAIDLLGEMTLDDLLHDRTLQLALVRLVEIVGEASTRVAGEVKDQHPAVPWRDIAGMRNKLIHEYEYVDVTIVYNTVRHDLPPLIALLDEVLA